MNSITLCSILIAAVNLCFGISVNRTSPPIADIALIIDQSGSIGTHHYKEEIEFAKKFVDAFPVAADRTRFALIEFSLSNMTAIRMNWNNGTSLDQVHKTLDDMSEAQLGAGTDFARALQIALQQLQRPEQGDRPEAPNVAVLITDGYLNSVWERKPALEAARLLRESGTILYAIHVKLDPSIASAPIDDLTTMTGNRSRVFAVDDFNRLTNDLLSHITQQISDEYQDCIHEYLPEGVCYRSQLDNRCVREAKLRVVRPAQEPHGRACPSELTMQMECSPGECQAACEKWPWGPWSECKMSDGSKCGDVIGNATKTRSRAGTASDSKLGNSCKTEEIVACSRAELSALACPVGSAEGISQTTAAGASSGLPIWAIILIVVVAVVVAALIIAGIVIARTPKWRVVFAPNKERRNQLPGNADETSSNASV